MGKNKDEKQTIITIPKDLYEEVKRWAGLWGCTVEEFVNEALSRAIEEEKKR